MSRPLRVLTWNLQGSQGLDVAGAAEVVRVAGVDVVALQEVQRRHAARLAAALSLGARRWALKHWPVVHRAEGLAVLSAHRFVRAEPFVLRRAPIWHWQRRVGLDVTIDRGGADVARVLDVHLSPDDQQHRRREAGLVMSRAASGPPAVIAGDLNDLPREGAVAAFTAAGWLDAWTEWRGGDAGATNWTGGPRRGRPPTQRIDYVLAPPGSTVTDAVVIDATDGADLDAIAQLSDHVPVVAELRLPDGAPT